MGTKIEVYCISMNTPHTAPARSYLGMEVIKRNGKREKVEFDKITRRIEALCFNVEPKLDMKFVDPISVAKEVIDGMYSGITTEELDDLSADVCASRISDHPSFNDLAARISISNLQKQTTDDMAKVATALYEHMDEQGVHNPLITEELHDLIQKHKERINTELNYDRDFRTDFFGIKTLERSYLKRIKRALHHQDRTKSTATPKREGKQKDHEVLDKVKREKWAKGIIVERPQHMWMRVALGIHRENLELAFETYHLMSQGYFTHATPTLFNAGTYFGNLISCFLLGMHDSIRGIFKTATDCGFISKRAGGIGVHMSSVRAQGSRIRTTNGVSNGIVPWCRLLCEVARSVNQGGKRNGSIAVYLEPWHADIFDFCELRKNTGTEMRRARDLFLALWVPDLFMQRVKEGGVWSLFCPDEAPGLTDCHGAEFNELYLRYEKEKKYKRQVKAQKLWFHILECQIETGMPYMTYKDSANAKTNQKNVGIIRSSNLCAEIFEYSDDKEYATCNLASISLPAFIETKENGELKYNYDKLAYVAGVITRNLDNVIDINYYPVPETKVSNFRHRPIGIGIQGLADLFCRFRVPFDSEEARVINRKVHETIYYGAMKMTIQLAKERGAYQTFKGSPFSEGKLQFDLWGVSEDDLLMEEWDWKTIKEDIVKYGARNSLLTAIMPTASTSQILGNNECIEPFTTNLYTRSTLAGNYTIVNKYLVNDLVRLGLWDDEMREELFYFTGSIQHMDRIPYDIKQLYKTSFELQQKALIQLAIDRGPFVDQSQSLNLFVDPPDFDRLSSAHFFGWEGGLKTGLYYLRGKPAANAISFGLDPDAIKRIEKKYGINRFDFEATPSEEISVEVNAESEQSDNDDDLDNTRHGYDRRRLDAFLAVYGDMGKDDNYEPCENCSA